MQRTPTAYLGAKKIVSSPEVNSTVKQVMNPIQKTNYEKWTERDRILHPNRSVAELEERIYVLYKEATLSSLKHSVEYARKEYKRLNSYEPKSEIDMHPYEINAQNEKKERNVIEKKRAFAYYQAIGRTLEDCKSVDADLEIYKKDLVDKVQEIEEEAEEDEEQDKEDAWVTRKRKREEFEIPIDMGTDIPAPLPDDTSTKQHKLNYLNKKRRMAIEEHERKKRKTR